MQAVTARILRFLQVLRSELKWRALLRQVRVEVKCEVGVQQVPVHLIVELLLDVLVEFVLGHLILGVQLRETGQFEAPDDVLLLQLQRSADLEDLVMLDRYALVVLRVDPAVSSALRELFELCEMTVGPDQIEVEYILQLLEIY
jgi:hypothetical protein